MDNSFETLARAGYIARGVVYLLLGGLALSSAIWGGEDAEGSSDALSSLLGLPFGRVLLALVAVGLLGYVLWKLAQSLLNADDRDHDLNDWATRAGQLISAVANLFLMFTAARMALAMGGGEGGGNGEETASAWLLQQPFGPYLLGAVGAGVIGFAGAQFWYGATGGYRKHLSLPSGHGSWLDRICAFGLMARGAVFAIIGGFVLYAAFTVSAEQAGGTADALDYVRRLPFGAWLYGLGALGLAAFGAYGVIQGLYRHVDAPDMGDVRAASPL
ncbi:DUF1206 domain-containing protein [Devosia neptuniae]|jgi:hypothetical protein|uniref:DUF1206 domain-containing protein n=1 Tax=Devosia TaxID=46913 RepID=UPI0022AE6C83|nr:DUF1206 domain-containing protein [Devosia neptuniae]MCZ4347974.1 DUF1206 domain-containing protein [Devosia neptuniae]|tara:strand:- start:72070 stop:72888 length:819 start_codon:yes stop_codon:yes gene_type:complete